MFINITQLSNAGTFTEGLTAINGFTGGAFVGMILICVLFVMFLVLKSSVETEKAMATTAIVGFMISIMLSGTGLLNIYFLLFLGPVAAIAGFYLYASSQK